jgi:class 3 adenylate cyclase
VRQQIARFRGREVKSLGDGFLVTFDGPARAVRCASAIAQTMRPLGIAVRSGLHTGEIEVKHDDIGGIAVNIAARVVAMAWPEETLVSSTVRDLVAGSGLRFEDRGFHLLRVLPEEAHLFGVQGWRNRRRTVPLSIEGPKRGHGITGETRRLRTFPSCHRTRKFDPSGHYPNPHANW